MSQKLWYQLNLRFSRLPFAFVLPLRQQKVTRMSPLCTHDRRRFVFCQGVTDNFFFQQLSLKPPRFPRTLPGWGSLGISVFVPSLKGSSPSEAPRTHGVRHHLLGLADILGEAAAAHRLTVPGAGVRAVVH